MKVKIFLSALILLPQFIISGCGERNQYGLQVGEIAGPCPSPSVIAEAIELPVPVVYEGECIELQIPDQSLKPHAESGKYTIKAIGDTGIRYTWSYYPDEAGEIVGESLGIHKQSTTSYCYFRYAQVTEPTEVILQVEVISTNYGPIIRQRKIIIEPESGEPEFKDLHCEWMVEDSSMGFFLDPFSVKTEFCAAEANEDKKITVFCFLYNEDCLPGVWHTQIEIRNS